MRSFISLLVLSVFLLSFVSADIEFVSEPTGAYNFGDLLETTIKITSGEQGIYDYLQISLDCGSYINHLPKEAISIGPNSEFNLEKSILLINKFVGKAEGLCRLKASLDESSQNSLSSGEFLISNSLNILAELNKNEFKPGETITISGEVTKENGKAVNGVMDLTASSNIPGNKTNSIEINGGDFTISFTLPRETPSGAHSINLEVYEVDPAGEKSNIGNLGYNIRVSQVPTSLEIIFENDEVEPGNDLQVKSILYDQSGKKINSGVILTVKDSNNRILHQEERMTDEFLEFYIESNEAPGEWAVVGVSNRLTTESSFIILENKDVDVDLINATLILTNVGNVEYDEVLLVKLGDESIEIYPDLEVGEVKKYTLSAPNGEYSLEILANDQSKITGNVALTGNAIDVKEQSSFGLLFRYPLAWIFMIGVLGFVSYMFYKRGMRETFFGRIGNLKSKFKKSAPSLTNDNEGKIGSSTSHVVHENEKNKAQLSISMVGEKQSSTILCMKIKNHEELSKKAESTTETLDKITNLATDYGAYVYQAHDSLFFIWAPLVTKTFKNEIKAVDFAQEVEEIIKNHNKLFKQKIDSGISLNHGDIVAKKERNVLKFMGLGNIINNSKKLASLSDGEVYLSPEVKGRVMSKVKTERVDKGDTEVYVIKEIKKDREDHKKFLSAFIKRLEDEKKDKKN